MIISIIQAFFLMKILPNISEQETTKNLRFA